MKPHDRPTRDALTRLRAAVLDLTAAKRFTESNDVLAIIERIDPPLRGEAAGSAAMVGARTGRSESATLSPTSSAPATYAVYGLDGMNPDGCDNCGRPLPQHCTTHLLPCCPGSLMHGMDEGTWTPARPESTR